MILLADILIGDFDGRREIGRDAMKEPFGRRPDVIWRWLSRVSPIAWQSDRSITRQCYLNHMAMSLSAPPFRPQPRWLFSS